MYNSPVSSKLTQENIGYNTSTLNQSPSRRDMFDPVKREIKQIQSDVDYCVNVCNATKKNVDLAAQLGDLEKCKVVANKGLQGVKHRIENPERNNCSPNNSPSNSINNSPSNSETNSPSKNVNNSPNTNHNESTQTPMFDGLLCKKTDAKVILISQVDRFKKLFEELINLELTAKNPSSENYKDLDEKFAEIKLQIGIANGDFEDLDKEISQVLARLGPTKRRHPVKEKRDANIALYKEFLSNFSKLALIKDQFEIYLPILAARIELLRPGKDLSQNMQNANSSLDNFTASSENVEVTGFLRYTYVKTDKEASFKARVQEVNDRLTIHTKEAMTYKAELQKFLAQEVISLDEQYFKDLAYGEKEQLDINGKCYSEAHSKTLIVRTELLKDINQIWQGIAEVQKQLYINLKQAVHAIEAQTTDSAQMYFKNKTLIAWKDVDTKELLNPDVNVKEMEFAWMKETKK